uniref:DNA 3'-5' helicase n=1 Tax=Pygocentrus nattereri TaxID=42514 RepID=A0AAR2LBZ5_PYGNA
MANRLNQEDHVRSQGLYKKNVLEDDLPYLEFGGIVMYSKEKNDCSFLSEDLRSSLAPGSAVGFDLEWPPSFTKGKSKKVALVQVCASEEKCYLFHLSPMSGFPPGLKMFLEDENIKKVGVGIEGDMWKLMSDYEIKLKNCIELSDLANKKLRCVEKWSLDGLVKHLFNKQLFKDKNVRCSHWDNFELTEETSTIDLLKSSADVAEDAVGEHSPNTSENQTPQNVKSDTMDHEAIQESSEGRDAYVPFKEPWKDSVLLEKDERPSVPSVHRECIMSHISEYELQMLEMQAREEEKEEQSILAFQVFKSGIFDSCCCHLCQLLSFPLPCADPSLPEPGPEQIKCLKMFFGHHNFKPVQWKVIQSVIQERRDNLVVMATGYGKSLCFQFPPVYCLNISVVISPLIALMEDQVLQLKWVTRRGLPFTIVYMTPEFCSGNISLLEQLNRSIGLSLIAVDEAHCISHWGHDFRGAYRDLGVLKRCLPDVPIVALTATASPSIRDDIVRSLRLVNPLITCTSFDRPNLYLDVDRKSGDIIKDLKRFLVKKNGGDYEFEGATIVYCQSKKEAERVTAALYKLGVRCGVYHAGLGIKQRRETQYQFMRDEIQCVVATVAFGMGINKPDIRKVIHYGAPKEMESYYQEIGRAGRDGLPSACHVLWMPTDMALNRFLLNQTKSDRFRGYKLEMMAKMEKYLNSTKCRRKSILSHFEDKQLRKVTSGILGTSKCCDNCSSDQDLKDFGPCAFQLMGAVSAMGEKFGITAPILLLRGSNSQKVPERFRKHPLYGAERSVSEAWWRALGRELISEKYLMESTGYNKFSTLCKLTPQGRTWLNKAQDERHRTLLLQPNRDLCPRAYLVSLSCALFKAELYGKLVAERQKLASIKDVPPAILATNKILLDMAKLRPCTVARLKQVEGVSEAKANMLSPLLQTILKFCQMHSLQVDFAASAAPCPVQPPSTQAGRASAVPLTDSVAVSYKLFQTEGKTDARSLPMAVVESHLLQAQKANHPLDTEKAGLSTSLFNTITRIVASQPLSSDLSDFKSIRTLVPEEIGTFQLQLCIAKLQREGFPKCLPSPPSAQHNITWIELQVS